MGLATGDGAVFEDEGIEIEGGPGVVGFGDADGRSVG